MQKHYLLNSKHTGILLPIFSMTSKYDLGIGDFSSMKEWLEFLKEINFDVLQILPINEMPPNTNCPYTSLTAFAIDPIYISIKDIENISPKIIEKLNSKIFKDEIKKIKTKNYIDYSGIKKIKFDILWEQYLYFNELIKENKNLKENFENYIKENDFWLDDYAIFRRLKDIKNWISWTDWEEDLKNHNYEKLEIFKKQEIFNINFFKFIQWEIEKQFKEVINLAKEYNIKIFGDLPFMVNQESADVWSRQYDFRIDLEAGAPPDAFSETGQKWGLPAYNWENVLKNNFEWWRLKTKKADDFYDIFRIDHMVGFFRTWVIPKDENQKPTFDYLDPIAQENRGRNFLKSIISSSKMLPIAEDLGVIPDYVYKVLKELNVCGYKVLRWEKNKDETYKEPETFDPVSLATTSTHDNEPMALWWQIAEHKEKKEFWQMIENKNSKIPSSYNLAKEKIIEKAMKSNSSFLIFPLQDLIASKERINEPNTVGEHNWSYKVKEEPQKFLEKYNDIFNLIKRLAKERNEKK